MGIVYRIESDIRLVIVRVVDSFDLHQAVGMTEQFANDARADYEYDFLVDFSANPHFDIDFARMLTMISRLEPFHQRRSADSVTVIYAPEDVAFGMARMYQSLVVDRAPYKVELCRTRPEVEAKLERSPDLLVAAWPTDRRYSA